MTIFHPNQLMRPTSLVEAAKILKESNGSARLVAGNTTLYDLAQHGGLDGVDTLVDVSRLGLDEVSEDQTRMHIGSATTFTKLANFPHRSGSGLDALFETAGKITPPQVRNVGTIGGALCSGIPFLDMPPTVLALAGEMKAVSVEGERKIAADDFFVDYFTTAMNPEEVLTSVDFVKHERAGSSFLKLGRVSVDFAVANVASLVQLDGDGRCKGLRVAIGAVGKTPIRWQGIEEKLTGQKLDREAVSKATKEVDLGLEPTSSLNAPTEYKKLVIPVLVRDSLLESNARANDTRTN